MQEIHDETQHLSKDDWEALCMRLGQSAESLQNSFSRVANAMRTNTPKLKNLESQNHARPYTRDKSANTPQFNKMAKKRRAKAKHDSKNRKKNR